jgi:hypothetical protein
MKYLYTLVNKLYLLHVLDLTLITFCNAITEYSYMPIQAH